MDCCKIKEEFVDIADGLSRLDSVIVYCSLHKAAPQMLEALKVAEACIDYRTNGQYHTLKTIRDAIANATRKG